MVKVPGLCYYNAGLFRLKIYRILSKTKDFLKSLIIKHFIYKKKPVILLFINYFQWKILNILLNCKHFQEIIFDKNTAWVLSKLSQACKHFIIE